MMAIGETVTGTNRGTPAFLLALTSQNCKFVRKGAFPFLIIYVRSSFDRNLYGTSGHRTPFEGFRVCLMRGAEQYRARGLCLRPYYVVQR